MHKENYSVRRLEQLPGTLCLSHKSLPYHQNALDDIHYTALRGCRRREKLIAQYKVPKRPLNRARMRRSQIATNWENLAQCENFLRAPARHVDGNPADVSDAGWPPPVSCSGRELRSALRGDAAVAITLVG